MPPKFICKVMDVTTPWLLSIVNSSLSPGCVPEYLKTACVQPLIKKPGLDPSEFSNYQFQNDLLLQKILEKTVSLPLLETLRQNNIYEKIQSGFRQQHSTETVLMRVTNDLLRMADTGECSILVVLDLSAAFDTVNHKILIERLQHWVGISGKALKWFCSYLTNRKFLLVTMSPLTH